MIIAGGTGARIITRWSLATITGWGAATMVTATGTGAIDAVTDVAGCVCKRRHSETESKTRRGEQSIRHAHPFSIPHWPLSQERGSGVKRPAVSGAVARPSGRAPSCHLKL